ncbi:putative rubisco accumulation factor 1 [Dioscorea sansibarensis]
MASSSMLSSTPSFHLPLRRRPTTLRRISASKLPSPPPPTPPGQAYQPFRPPPSPLPPKYRSLSPLERLDVLRDRLGLWHEYAPLLASLLTHEGFTPPFIEEITGITGIEQNRLAVAAQVRDSLISSSFDPDLLPFFDSLGGSELLYELRFLNATQRSATARHIVINCLDPKSAQDLARAVKDFPRRRGDDGWTSFSADSPGDCLAYTYFRLSLEALATPDRVAALEKALDSAETESAKARVEKEIEKASKDKDAGDGDDEEEMKLSIPVVRLRYGEVAEASSVALIPVVREMDGAEGVEAAPAWCKTEGEMGVVAAEKGWGRWVVLPGWGPVAALGGGVAVEFGDAKVLPWKTGKYEKKPAVVVVDRRRRAVEVAEGLYLVAGERKDKEKEKEKGWLGVKRGKELIEKGIKDSLGIVVLVVRPPMEEQEYQLRDEDWE